MLIMCKTYVDHVANSAHNKILLLHKGLPVHCNTTNAEPMRPASAKSETPLSTTLQEHGGGSCEALGYHLHADGGESIVACLPFLLTPLVLLHHPYVSVYASRSNQRLQRPRSCDIYGRYRYYPLLLISSWPSSWPWM